MKDTSVERSRDRLELGFLDHEKIKGILNFDLPLILVVTIANLNLTGFLVDDESSCNVLYADTLEWLGLHQTCLNLYRKGDLLAFNDSVTHYSGTTDMTLAIGEGVRER